MNETIEGLCKEAAYHAQQYEEKLAAANYLNALFTEKLAADFVVPQHGLPVDTRASTLANTYKDTGIVNGLAADLVGANDQLAKTQKNVADWRDMYNKMEVANNQNMGVIDDLNAKITGLTDDLTAAQGKQNWMQNQIDSLTKAKNNALAQADTLGQELQSSISRGKADAAASRRFKDFARGQIANAKKYYGIGGAGIGALGTLGLSKLLGGSRPQPGMLEQAGNWVRSNPGMAAGAGLLGAGALAAPFMMGGEKEGSFRGDFNSLTPNEKVAIYRELLTNM